jgi:xanthosine utilization system XapX-like protein
MRSWLVVFVAVFAIVIVFALFSQPAPPKLSTSITAGLVPAGQVLGARTKSAGCTVQSARPDSACSPGAVAESATKERICTPGYAKSARNVPSSEKQQVYAEYGIVRHQPGQYEIDHLVSLELGGSNDISNLWPEAANPTPGFHQKDAVEDYLHQQVCNGALSLTQAQSEIAGNWLAVYQAIPR